MGTSASIYRFDSKEKIDLVSLLAVAIEEDTERK